MRGLLLSLWILSATACAWLWSAHPAWSICLALAAFPRPLVIGFLQFEAASSFLFPAPIHRHCGDQLLWGCQSNLKNIATACEMYAEDHQGQYPPSMLVLKPEYLKRFPGCPCSGKAYLFQSSPSCFTICCSSGHY